MRIQSIENSYGVIDDKKEVKERDSEAFNLAFSIEKKLKIKKQCTTDTYFEEMIIPK